MHLLAGLRRARRGGRPGRAACAADKHGGGPAGARRRRGCCWCFEPCETRRCPLRQGSGLQPCDTQKVHSLAGIWAHAARWTAGACCTRCWRTWWRTCWRACPATPPPPPRRTRGSWWTRSRPSPCAAMPLVRKLLSLQMRIPCVCSIAGCVLSVQCISASRMSNDGGTLLSASSCFHHAHTTLRCSGIGLWVSVVTVLLL